ncbi:uncharacterized protein B0P05DRAFT_642512 [Gilbertella persicaria]|uniref:uncharacterized protein n=1 Tax=Gilbertella persicaria TaxID=101096 RepID=UPI00222016B0|nr:uncharacterized protein B0P05DRAFT_642512 [Gilbertella persicaria]KAI8046984.1 hypothetical protein B0P05DRAFT_642512 [Gilbertella persicaria]
MLKFLEVKKLADEVTGESDVGDDEEVEEELADLIHDLHKHSIKSKKACHMASKSSGRIPCQGSGFKRKSTTCSKNPKMIDALEPDFLLYTNEYQEEYDLLSVEVKKPDAKVSQALSDLSEMALELKKMIDHHVLLGVSSPKSFGLVVAGVRCDVFFCSLNSHGLYKFFELERFYLPRDQFGFAIVPAVIITLLRLKASLRCCLTHSLFTNTSILKNLVDRDAAELNKKSRTDLSSSLLANLIETKKGLSYSSLNVIVYIAANQWEKYLARIEELCASKWLKQCKRTSEGLLMSQTRECHRHGHSTPFRSSRISSKDSKKVGFKAALSILQFKNDSLVVQIKVPIGHGFHVPREEGDFRTLPLTTETVQIKESLYRFDTNDFVSLNIWLNRHLPLKNYAIENCNIQLYNSDDRIFVRGSPSLVRTIQSMSNIFEVTRCVNPETITIDYYVAELNTIRNVLEGVYVYYCGFHVLKVWRKALDRKIKLSGAHTQEEVGTYKKQLEGLITQLLHEV